MTSLRQVLDRLRSAKLTAKPSKCIIGYGSIECLGHKIVDQTVRPQEDNFKCNFQRSFSADGYKLVYPSEKTL